MIRLVTEAKFHMDMHCLGIFVRNNEFPVEVKAAFDALNSVKPQYIGEYSVIRRLTIATNSAGLLAEAFGEKLLSPDSGRYVHLEEMFRIVHGVYWNASDYLREVVRVMAK